VASVAVFSGVPLTKARRIALDISSRTSVALLRVLCDERFGIGPALVPCGPDLEDMLRQADAALLIGDPALWTDHDAKGLLKIDLGEEWTAHTDLPFVWAFWAGRAGAVDVDGAAALVETRDRGTKALDEIAARYAGGDVTRFERARAYLRENIHFWMGDRHIEAIRRFYRSAARLGLVTREVSPVFFDRAVPTGPER
jgi:chorismate dehydratase